MEYTVLIGRSGNGYAAMVEGLSGVCTAAAETRAETESLIHEALELHLEEERLSEVSGVTSMYLESQADKPTLRFIDMDAAGTRIA